MTRILKYALPALACLVFSCSVERNLTLVQYSVGVFNKSGSDSMDEIVAMMKEAGADVLSLNELDSCTTRTGGVFQLGEFASKMGSWDYTFARAIDYKGGGYGIGLASDPRREVVGRDRFILDRGEGDEYRACAVQEFRHFVVLTTHLEHRHHATALAQAKAIDEWAAARYGISDKPVFLCGDLNSRPESAVLEMLKGRWKVLSPEECTYSADNPHKCIDYVLLLDNPGASRVRVRKAAVLKGFSSGDVRTASDHLPVLVKFSIKR